jgi:TorA maturation chaperone TorD
MSSQPLRFTPAADDREELARAEVYGLLAQLFYAPPSQALYEQIRAAPTQAPIPGGLLEASWSELVAVARRLASEQVADEYDALFQGIGKPEVFLYASHHLAGALNEKPLVALRNTLRRLGLTRADDMAESEDHFAYLCEVMRYLIAGEDLAVSRLETQKDFFDAHLRGWPDAMCDQIARHPAADFYRAVAGFAHAFLSVESQAFDMLE